MLLSHALPTYLGGGHNIKKMPLHGLPLPYGLIGRAQWGSLATTIGWDVVWELCHFAVVHNITKNHAFVHVGPKNITMGCPT